jgi:uncharacterized protein (TIGR03086 family)
MEGGTMTSSADESIEVLAVALDQTADVLAAIPSDKMSEATPCGDWAVSSLIAHVVAAPGNFMMMARGESPDWSKEPPLPSDWTAEFRAGADELLATWKQVDDPAAQGVDWQIAEFAVHTWDLARATGQSTDLDPRVAQRGLGFMSAALTSENRGEAFGPPVEISDESSVYDKLAAFAGRDPR